MKYIKEHWKFLLFVLIGGLVGGYFLGIYGYDSLSEETLKLLQEQNVTKCIVIMSTMLQYGILYGVILALIGLILSKKTNLWKRFKFDKKAVIITSIITVISALILFPGDKLIFGRLSDWVSSQYTIAPTLPKTLGGLLVGGIIEEVMMRLFFMTLLVFVISKVFYNNKGIPTKVYVISNIIAALVFAAGHLPSTSAMTDLTTILIIRCFLFNGLIGACFGYLYRKYGIGYAMISHGLCHLIADILMLIFI